MINIGALNGVWKVTSAKEVTNVKVATTSTIRFDAPTGGDTATCSFPPGSTFVNDPESTTMPVRWEEPTTTAYSFNSATGLVTAGVPSAGTSGTDHPVVINVVNGILTCVVDPDNSPGGIWHGTHP